MKRPALFSFVAACLWLLCTAISCSPQLQDETSSDNEEASVAHDPLQISRGRALLAKYQCNRCHRVPTALAENPSHEQDCLGCHGDIIHERAGPAQRLRGNERSAQLQQWNEHLINLRYSPSLHGQATLLRRAWLENYLQRPHDIRPRLGASMPRLDISVADARDMVAVLIDHERVVPFFADKAIGDYQRDVAPFGKGDVTIGRGLFADKGCGSCHQYSGVVAAAQAAPHLTHSPAMTLAPDLRHTRARFRPNLMVPWLLDADYHKGDTKMPRFNLSYAQARHLASFVMLAPIELLAPNAATSTATPTRLPVLTREVFYDEVRDAVLAKSCMHCHSEAALELGDGGPGYSGGFGFKARRVSFGSYEAVFAGRLADDGRYHSLFEPTEDGTPFLVAVMLARQQEEIGNVGPVRGMPLGFPALTSTQIQLVESWIAQGRRRGRPATPEPAHPEPASPTP